MSPYGLSEAERSLRAVCGCGEHVGGGPRRDQLHATHFPSGETHGPKSAGMESRASSLRSGTRLARTSAGC